MNPSEIERQSERMPLDERRLEQFKAEDARIASTMRTYGQLLVSIAALEAENAELRQALLYSRGYVAEYACDNPDHPVLSRIDAALAADRRTKAGE